MLETELIKADQITEIVSEIPNFELGIEISLKLG
jgi:hypothetical protein